MAGPIGCEKGNMSVLMAMGLAISAIISVFAVDAAALNHERRLLQSGVDLAAIAAARDPANAHAIARHTLIEAGVLDEEDPEGILSIEIGRYTPEGALAPASRFAPGAGPVNAVRVQASKPGRLHFARVWSPAPRLGATATATATPRIAFSIGSRLAALEGGIANAVLNRLLGTQIALSVLDYNGIAGARLSMLAFLDALAFELGIAAGTYDDVLAASATHGQIARAIAASLEGSAAAAAGTIASAIGPGPGFGLSRLVGLGDLGRLAIGSSGRDLFVGVDALELLAASAALANGTRQLDLNLLVNLPGVTGVAARVAIGEPPQSTPWFAIGPQGSVARTAQVRARITTSLLGGAGLLGAGVTLPIYAEIAHAEAVAGEARCPSPSAPHGSATILARPGAARLAIGWVGDPALVAFNTLPAIARAQIVNVLLLRISGRALIEIAQTTPVPLSFSSAEIAAGTVKSVSTQTIATSLVGSLLSRLDLDVSVLTIGLGVGAVTNALHALLAPVAPALDAILSGLLQALGVRVGEADIRVYGVVCGHPVLVG